MGSESLTHERNQCVTRLVIGGHALLLIGQQHRLALGAHQHLVLGQLEVVHRDLLAVHARRVQRRLVDHVGQISAAEARRSARQHIQVGVVGDRNLLHVHAQNLFAAANIRQSHHHAAIKASRPQQRRDQARRAGSWPPPESRRRSIQSRPSPPATGSASARARRARRPGLRRDGGPPRRFRR